VAIALRYAARSDVGLVRQNNQDSGYAGPHLLVIADGMGGHAGGDVASSLAIGELAPLDGESHGSDDALAHLERAVRAAHAELLARVQEEPQLAGMGTTITALMRAGNRLALAHIGDSRAYLLRDGGLTQITKDHTFVQTLVDEGRLTPEEAEHHPQRSVLMRVLSDIVDDPEPDFSIRESRVGDRYLLCSDGLSGVVSFETLQETLGAGDPPGASPTRALPAQSSPGVTAGSGGASPSLPGQPSPSSSAAATCGGAP
jgi:protein phosphatase